VGGQQQQIPLFVGKFTLPITILLAIAGNMARRVISSLAGVLLLATTTRAAEFPKAKPEEVGMSSAILDNIGRDLLNATTTRNIPGAVTMVARHGKVRWQSGPEIVS